MCCISIEVNMLIARKGKATPNYVILNIDSTFYPYDPEHNLDLCYKTTYNTNYGNGGSQKSGVS